MPGTVIRVAALADLHCTKTSQGAFQPLMARIAEAAEMLLIAGDLTDYGLPEEARVLAKELASLRIPMAAVLHIFGDAAQTLRRSREIMRIDCTWVP